MRMYSGTRVRTKNLKSSTTKGKIVFSVARSLLLHVKLVKETSNKGAEELSKISMICR
jgi:hypothetical protein